MLTPLARRLLLLVLPLALIGPALLPGKRLLPVLPEDFAPWRIEAELAAGDEDARAAREIPASLGASPGSGRRLPWLTDAAAIGRVVRSGSLPTWDPTIALGMPLAATTSLGAWYPPNLLVWFAPADLARGWLALLALGLAGFGMDALLRARGLTPTGALVGAIALQASAFAAHELAATARLDAALWLPWTLACVEGVRARRPFAPIGLALAIGLAGLAGVPATAGLVVFVTVLVALARAPRALLWIGLGALGAAVEVVPRFEAGGLLDAADDALLPVRVIGVAGGSLAVLGLALTAGRAALPTALAAVGLLTWQAIGPLTVADVQTLAWVGLAWLGALAVDELRERAVRVKTTLTVVAVAALFGEGLVAARTHLAPRTVRDGGALALTESVRAMDAAARGGRLVRWAASADATSPATEDAGEPLAPSNLPSAFGLADLGARTTRAPRRLLELVRAVDPTAIADGRVAALSSRFVLGHPLLDLLRVEAVLSATPLKHERLELVAGLPGFATYRRDGAAAPARVVRTLQPAEHHGATVELLASATLDPALYAVVSPDEVPPPPLPSVAPGFEPGTVEVARPAAHRVEAVVRGSTGGWLVFHEAYYPGWKATVDGRDANVLRVDHAFRAVAIPAGDCVVRTKFEPWSLRVGAVLSVLTLLLLVMAAARTRHAAARTPSPHATPGPLQR